MNGTTDGLVFMLTVHNEPKYVLFGAHARLAAAEALAADGRRADADEQIARALVFFRSVGATRYIREGEAILAATA